MEQFIAATRPGIERTLEHCVDHGEHTKVFCTVRILMQKIRLLDGTVEMEDPTHMSVNAMALQTRGDIDEFITNVREGLETHIENYTSKGSNWIVGSIEEIALRLVRYRLLKGGAATFKVPQEISCEEVCPQH